MTIESNTVQFTQGNAVTLDLFVTDGNDQPVDITGADLTTLILGPGGEVVTFGPDQHTIVDGPGGEFHLELDESDTGDCNVGANKDILTTAVISSKPLTYRGMGILQVFPPVPLA